MALLKDHKGGAGEHPLFCVSMNENSWLYWRKSFLKRYLAISTSFHEWKFMALLKHSLLRLPSLPCTVFPWMKIHGSIEAWQIRWAYYHDTGVSMNENSWLYWSPLYSNPIRIPPTFPWMKIHGSIEALLMVSPRIPDRHVSMNENSWLYWSPEISHRIDEELLKFPWMKIHGSIEAGT